MAGEDPYRNFRYRLEIDEVAHGHFSEVAIGDTAAEATDPGEGADPPHARRPSGGARFGNITLKWGMTDSIELHNWCKTAAGPDAADNRKTVRIVTVDEAGADQASFRVSGAWPTKYAPSDLNPKGNEVAIESLELANDGIERAPGQGS